MLSAPLLAAGPALAAGGLSVDEIVEMEELLAELGFDPGPIDGKIDRDARSAISGYQEFAALQVDGRPSEALLVELRLVVQAFAQLKAAQAAETAGEAEKAEKVAQAAREAEEAEKAAQAAREAKEAEKAAQAAQEAEKAAQAAREAEEAEKVAQAAREAEEAEKAAQAARAAEEAEKAAQAAREAAEAAKAAQAAAPPEPAPQVAATTQAEAPDTQVPASAAPESKTPEPVAKKPPPRKPASAFNLEGVISKLVSKPSRPKATAAAAVRKSISQARVSAARAGRADGYRDFKLGFAAAENGELDLAIEHYTLAIEAGDLSLEHLAAAFYNRANAYHYKRLHDYAIADYNAAILNKPNFPGAYYNRGFTFEAKGERQRAVDDFTQARNLGLQRLGVRSPDLPPPLL